MSKRLKYHIVSTLIIFLAGSFFSMVVFCSNCLENPYFLSKLFFIHSSYSGLSWVAYWKGSEFLVELWDRLIPWIDAPLKRLIVSTISIVIFIFLIVWGIDLFYDLIVFKKTLSESLKSSSAPYVSTLIVTLVINIFMHGRGFLYSWRQASIDVEKLKVEQVSTQYESLKNQVNPHFLFNSLNVLSELVYEDQDKAVDFIRKFSQVYRYVLDSKDEEVVPLIKEMDFVENFTFLQKIRFGDNLKIEINTFESNTYVPPLAVQLLVENAIKHNVISEQNPLAVAVIINKNTCTVRNSLKEKQVKDSTGIGLKNLIERYKYLTDEKVIINREDDSFEVTIPLLKTAVT